MVAGGEGDGGSGVASFKGRPFTGEVILWAVRWYLMFPVSYRDLELMLADRGVAVDHTTIFRWIQAYAAELEKRVRPHLCSCNGSWRVDETYIKVKRRWTYLYRAVDSRGQTIDFLLSAKRDTAAAKRFFRKALGQPHTVNPHTITVDKNAAYPKAVAEMKATGELWRRSRLRQCKYLNDILEQDHRRVKRLTGPGLGFGSFRTARRTLAGYEAMAMMRKGQVRKIGGRDMKAQAVLVAELFQFAPDQRPPRAHARPFNEVCNRTGRGAGNGGMHQDSTGVSWGATAWLAGTRLAGRISLACAGYPPGAGPTDGAPSGDGRLSMLAAACGGHLKRLGGLAVLVVGSIAGAAAQPPPTMRAQDFLASLGVNVHLEYTDGAYASTQQAIADLDYLGIHLIRDGMPNPNGGIPYLNYTAALDAVTAAGNRIVFIAGAGLPIAAALSQAGHLATAHRGSVVGIEGPNEINNFPVTYRGKTGEDAARGFQRDLYAAVKTDPVLARVPVYYFTGGTPIDLAANAQLADYANAHPYPYGGQQPADRIAQEFARNFKMATPYPRVITETGYYTVPSNPYGSGVDEVTAAKLTLNLLLDAVGQGVSRTYLYQLRTAYPDPDGTNTDAEYGLFRLDNSPRAAAVAIHNLTWILADPGPTAATFTPRARVFTLSRLPARCHTLRLARSDGWDLLVIWAEPDIWNEIRHAAVATPHYLVGLRFPVTVPRANLLDPLASAAAIATWANVDEVAFDLSDHPIIIEISPPDR